MTQQVQMCARELICTGSSVPEIGHLRKNNRFFHTFLGKTGWSFTSDRNFMSFREWSAAERAKRHKNFYHEWKFTRAFPKTHESTYFFRKPTTFTLLYPIDSPLFYTPLSLTSNQNAGNKNVIEERCYASITTFLFLAFWLDDAASTDVCAWAHLYWVICTRNRQFTEEWEILTRIHVYIWQ